MATAPALIEDGCIRAINPRTFEVMDSFPVDPVEALPAALARCREAQSRWVALPLKERLDVLGGVLPRVVERAEHLADIVRQDHGKSTTEAYFSEVLGVAEVVRTHLKYDRRWLKPSRVALDPLSYPGKRARVEWVPRGLIGLITP